MKFTPFLASAGLLQVQAVLAQTTTTGTPTTVTSATTTSSTATCTASLITKLCDYTEPASDSAVAEDSVEHCWEYCNNHPPCNFVIFAAGNPTTGSGTCWLYPGETYDESAGSSDCSSPYLSVYSQPTCSGGSTTTTACAATATPSAIAEVCDYPTPDDNCFSSCVASSGAVDCLSRCVEADDCNYVVFNPHNDDDSQYGSGTCWMYDSGSYNASAASTCSGDPEQYVYNNVCPKASSSSTTLLTSTTTGTAGTVAADSTASSASESQTSAAIALSRRNPLAAGMRWLARE
ncbi:hypothetical protein PFICI_12328 [Pestalotiopsis fici W106-1]|uniref:Apple domain-containing protein n=1 Tax=Pestalotiopsis fici (strain W106-1 / CGMCC3.15140) TaxID=1229662 RepID=W3WNL8_PESFW|nr:uncharacterized protein PFICI_12328 [Pestalotiopsis fici W106-1]ETS75384.1 hypothetical protein PFICI_12328 [Pestalotiopsis fici W106-1]